MVQKIEIRFANSFNKGDNEIATEVLNALKSKWSVPNDKVQVKVENGWITLEGELAWNYQKDAAKEAVKYLLGVKGVSNNIKIKSEIHDEIEQQDVKAALERNWSINTDEIKVRVAGSKVTLTGIVDSFYQKDEAEKIAWNTPSIWTVDNELEVEYDYALVD